jgi:hypothetical protein
MENGLGARCLAGGMDSRFPGLAVASCPEHALRCRSSLRVSFSGSEIARQKLSSPTQSLWGTAAAATAAAAADALDRVAGMIKKAAYRSSGRRVRGEDDKIPAIKTVAPDLLLDVLHNMDIRVDPWSAPPCQSDVRKGRHSHSYLSFDPRDRAHRERDAPRPLQQQGQGRRALPRGMNDLWSPWHLSRIMIDGERALLSCPEHQFHHEQSH